MLFQPHSFLYVITSLFNSFIYLFNIYLLSKPATKTSITSLCNFGTTSQCISLLFWGRLFWLNLSIFCCVL
uniref:ATKDSA2 n=1 Tax=Arundo donax TaxID=35708 RepID=A0A0A8YA74_ARUDO